MEKKREKGIKTANAPKEKAIVVIGDWYIDESWLVSRQKLKHSSHPGDIHFKVMHEDMKKRVISLCGTAELFKVLHSYFKNEQSVNPVRFIGVGVWNPDDHEMMKCILCDKSDPKYLTPYTLRSVKEPWLGPQKKSVICPYSHSDCNFVDLELINLANRGIYPNKFFSTNRVIRCYEGSDVPHLLYRFDWIYRFSVNDLNYEECQDKLSKYDIQAIVIEDHGLGILNEKCIRALRQNSSASRAKWFIRTKTENPIWYETLKENKPGIFPSLILTDFHMAAHKKGERRWFFENQLGRAALEFLGEMTGDVEFKHGKRLPRSNKIASESAAVLLDNNTAFFKERDYCYGIHQIPGKKQIVNIGRTTIMYAALIAQKLKRNNLQKFDEKQAVLSAIEYYRALRCAYQWSVNASKLWQKEREFICGDYQTALQELSVPLNTKKVTNILKGKYLTLWNDWNASSAECGVIERGEGDVLQIWRGEGVLPGYICVGGDKRDAINHFVSMVAKFYHDSSPKHPLSCVLTAAPGWGKSFLAKSLAKYFDMEFLEFSIAQMATNQDLVNCLATISSVQNRTQKKTLIFIDEINSQIEGHDVMSLLLSPLWEGTFIIEGRSYRLNPAVWIFASTERLSELVKNSKGSDFASRLNGPIIELDSLGDREVLNSKDWAKLKKILGKSDKIYQRLIYRKRSPYERYLKTTPSTLKTEQVYLMVKLLIDHWGSINSIQNSILKLFHDLLPINGVRSLEFFASSFEQIREGCIKVANVPRIKIDKSLRRHIIVPKIWWNIEDNKNEIKLSKSKSIEIETLIR